MRSWAYYKPGSWKFGGTFGRGTNEVWTRQVSYTSRTSIILDAKSGDPLELVTSNGKTSIVW